MGETEKPLERVALEGRSRLDKNGLRETFKATFEASLWALDGDVIAHPKELASLKERQDGFFVGVRVEALKDPKRFKDVFITKVKSAKNEGEMQTLLYSVLEDIPEGNDVEKREMARDRLVKVQALLEKYGISEVSEIILKSPAEIRAFAEEFGRIVGKRPEELIKKWILLGREGLEWEKLEVLAGDDSARKEIYDQMQAGGNVQTDVLCKKYGHLLKETHKKEAFLDLSYSAFVENNLDALAELDRLSVQNTIDPSEATVRVERDATGWYLADSLSSSGVHFEIKGGQILLPDPLGGDAITVNVGDNYGLKEALAVSDVRNVLKELLAKHRLAVPVALSQNARDFLLGKELSTLVNFISKEKVALGGVTMSRSEEIKSLYEKFFEFSAEKLRGLELALRQTSGDESYRRLIADLQLV